MVTCKEGLCRKYANLDEDGYCPTHTRTTDLAEEENCKCGVCNELVGNNSDSKALQCDAEKCKVWYHLCCTKISEALYDLMNVNSADNDDGEVENTETRKARKSRKKISEISVLSEFPRFLPRHFQIKSFVVKGKIHVYVRIGKSF